MSCGCPLHVFDTARHRHGMNAEMPQSFSTTKNQRTKTQPCFTQNNSTNKQISQVGRTSEYDCISKPEISWRYFRSNRPFNSMAIRFHRCLWMCLGFSGEGLRGAKYLSIEHTHTHSERDVGFRCNGVSSKRVDCCYRFLFSRQFQYCI